MAFDNYVELIGTVVFQRPLSAYIFFDGMTERNPKYKGQFVPKNQVRDVYWEDDNLTEITIRVSRYYYNMHIKWRLYG